MYQAQKPSGGFFLTIRGLRYHIRTWGDEGAPPVIFLHGGQDGSATFQIMVDCLKRDWRILAPDWRGHGQTEHNPQGYWFQDYVADLDALLEQLSPERPVTIVGHSLGGNASTVYAGLRPERVSRLVSLDGFGLPDRPAEEAPARLGRWLDSWRSPHSHKPYDNIAAMAGRLMKANERLSEDYALFLAKHMSRRLDDGMYVWAFDARLRAPFGWWNRRAEWAAYLGGVKAPVLFVGSGEVFPPAIAKEPDGLEGRVAFIPGAKYTRIDGTSHNLHHDAPQAVAALVEDFLADA